MGILPGIYTSLHLKGDMYTGSQFGSIEDKLCHTLVQYTSLVESELQDNLILRWKRPSKKLQNYHWLEPLLKSFCFCLLFFEVEMEMDLVALDCSTFSLPCELFWLESPILPQPSFPTLTSFSQGLASHYTIYWLDLHSESIYRLRFSSETRHLIIYLHSNLATCDQNGCLDRRVESQVSRHDVARNHSLGLAWNMEKSGPKVGTRIYCRGVSVSSSVLSSCLHFGAILFFALPAMSRVSDVFTSTWLAHD